MQKTNKNIKKVKKQSLQDRILNNKYSNLFILSGIIILTIIIFKNSLNNEFTTYDDTTLVINKYVTNFSDYKLSTYFTPDFIQQYDPLTIVSHGLVYQGWGRNPMVFHLVNLILHLFNVLLVFWFIRLLTDKKIIIIFTTLFFAIHPLHVESITWITERKDVLYSFFFLLSLISYIYYLKKDKQQYLYFLLALIFFASSLLSKFAAVVLPAILIVIDYYSRQTNIKRIIIDKIPFFVLTAIMGYIQLSSKHTIEGKQLEITAFNSLDKLFLCTYSLSFYLIKIIAPFNLYAIRPYPIKVNNILPTEYYLSSILIIILVVIVVWYLIKYPKYRRECIFGLMFFLINAALVLHIVPFGGLVIAADRYAYLSSIGIIFIFGYFYHYLFFNEYSYSKRIKVYVNSLIVIYVLFFCISTYQRNAVWKDSVVLFTDVIDKNPNVPFAWYARGNALQEFKRYEEALRDYNKSIELDSTFADRYYNRGLARFALRDSIGAYNDLTKAIKISPRYALAYFQRGLVNENLKRNIEAIKDYSKCLFYYPDLALAYNNRADIKLRMKDNEGAMKDFNMAVKLSPKSAQIIVNRAKVFLSFGRNQEAFDDCNRAISIDPNYPISYFYRGIAYLQSGDKPNGCKDLNTAMQLGMSDAAYYINKFCN